MGRRGPVESRVLSRLDRVTPSLRVSGCEDERRWVDKGARGYQPRSPRPASAESSRATKRLEPSERQVQDDQMHDAKVDDDDDTDSNRGGG